jgi:hypothetical protein
MKLKLTYFILLFTVTLSFSQVQGYDKIRSAEVILLNGDTLKVKGKLKSTSFKYKKIGSKKSIKLSYNKIDKIKIEFERDQVRTFYILPLKVGNKFIPVEKFITGDKVNLYGVNVNYNSPGSSGTGQIYYSKRKFEDKMTKLGAYSPPFGNLKDKLKVVFFDCSLLLDKIENKEYRVRYGSDILKMFEFFNEKCK